MSSDRISRRTAFLGLMALGGCGFAPVYGEDNALRNQISFRTQDSVAGFELRGRLEERLGVASSPRYVLSVRQSSRRRTAAITDDGDITRFNLLGTANWVLSDRSTGTRIKAGQVQTFTGYSATGATSATQAAEDDAVRRLSVALADLIVTRLLLLSSELEA
ncbi:LPS assembly lipoprotein LptE [Cognatiyoonia sp. IB215182]|uniref:LPS assembly lipoprotein LptE n=1 Tax=Cognatiyoonia sp. IB215182 TaxID=3097353 RepID=UPI002A15793B|nr:LPS assembly lipoprotein LptE [Cognatiyoonia sp. IB215182]MDX8355048.1 LPS assembly lipoprotein LptE [Cognatiyoonia sp. IB215182]